MSFNQSFKIKIRGDIRVGHHHILLLLLPQERKDAGKGFHTSGINFDSFLRKRREYIQSAVFTGQIPLAAGSQMVHKGMVVFAHNNGDIVDSAVYHAGQNKIHHTVTARKRNGCH